MIEKGFEDNKVRLEQEAKNLVTSFIEKEVSTTSEISGMWIDSLQKIDLSDIDLDGYQIVYIGDGRARLEVEGNFAYELTLEVEANSEAMYDREGGVYYGTLYRNVKIKDSKEEIFSLIADFDLEEGYLEIEVEELNDGNGFKIFHHDYD